MLSKKEEKFLKILGRFILRYIRVHSASLYGSIDYCRVTAIDVQNYYNTIKKKPPLYPNDILNVVSVYHQHIANCNIYLQNKILVDNKTKYDNVKEIKDYKKNMFYLVTDTKTFNLLKNIIKDHENF